jgi:D-aspartate ligase
MNARECLASRPQAPIRLQSSPGAVVMGGDYRGLALVRSLGRKGIPVWVINQIDQRLAGASCYVRRTFVHSDWNDESGIDFLLNLARQNNLQGCLLFPTADESVRLVSMNVERLSTCYQVTVPDWETLKFAVDKHMMQYLAEELDIAHPKTVYPQSREDLESAEFTFPVLLKPALRDKVNPLTVAKVWRADDRPTLLARYDEARRFLPPDILMVQELIPGGGECQFSYAAVCNKGEPLAWLVARRQRQFPIEFGRFSTYVETVEDPGIVAPATKFLRAIRYTGLVEVEFKKDPRNGQFKLLDINPRVWGWYSLCERAGVNFAYLFWLLFQGQPIPPVRGAQGVRWFRMEADLPVAMREILCGRLSLRDYFEGLFAPHEGAVFSWDDLWPGLIELPLFAALAVKRMLKQGRF